MIQSSDHQKGRNTVMEGCFPIPTFKLYGRVANANHQPEPMFVTGFVQKVNIVVTVLIVTVFLLLRLKFIGRHHTHSLVSLSVFFMVFSLGCGGYLMWVYLRFPEDPSQFCFIRFATRLFYVFGVISGLLAAIASFSSVESMTLNQNLTIIGGFMILLACTLVDLFRLCVAATIRKTSTPAPVVVVVEPDT